MSQQSATYKMATPGTSSSRQIAISTVLSHVNYMRARYEWKILTIIKQSSVALATIQMRLSFTSRFGMHAENPIFLPKWKTRMSHQSKYLSPREPNEV